MFFKKKSKPSAALKFRMSDIDPYLLCDLGYEQNRGPKSKMPPAWFFAHYR